jgi:predicted nucleic acid-binding protein
MDTRSVAKTPTRQGSIELVFFDTNILIYALLHGDPRRPIAGLLVAEGGLVSVQVLNEFVSVARKRFTTPWSELQEMLQLIHSVCGDAVTTSQSTHERGIALAQRYNMHTYDATIIASALEAGCDTLYSEDMQDGQQIGTLTIRNPFLAPA